MDRLTGSDLCASCLILQSKEQAKKIVCLGRELEMWSKIHDHDTRKIDDLLQTVFRQEQSEYSLVREITETTEILRKAVEDEDDGMA